MRTMVAEKSAAATVEFGKLFSHFDAWKHKIDSAFQLVSYDAKVCFVYLIWKAKADFF